MKAIPERSNRLTNDQAYPAAVDGYESLWETQNQQQLMIFSIASETWRVSTQKSAEDIVSFQGHTPSISCSANPFVMKSVAVTILVFFGNLADRGRQRRNSTVSS
jgi:hypothetical protein